MESAATAVATPFPNRVALRAEIESTKADFHALLDSLSDEDFKQKSANPAWTVGQLMYHLAWGTGFMGGELKSARSGKGFNPPRFLINPLNELNTRFGAMRATRASIAARFDTGIEGLLGELDKVRDDEWKRSSRNYHLTRTVEDIFRSSREHVDDHAAEIRAGLGRA